MTKKVTAEKWIEAEKLLADGKTQAEVARIIGCTQANISHRLGKRRKKLVIEDRPFAT